MTNNWDSYWQEEANRNYWLEPDKAVIELIEKLNKNGIKDVLDLGCGIGRHALYLAKCGYNVTAVDFSLEALAVLRKLSAEKELPIKIIEGDYLKNLFPAESFDLVLAFNVLYHGNRKRFRDTVQLIHTWLKPGGWLFFTCPGRRDAKYGNGEEISPHTFRPLNSVHPGDIHYFADEADISDFLSRFGAISKSMDEHYWDNDGTRQFSSYWQVTARK